jgi:phosphate-selective porin OprO/OprP
MRNWFWRQCLRVAVASAAILLLAAGTVAADEKLLEELKARLDRLEKQNEDLRKQLGVDKPPDAPKAPEKKSEKDKIEKVIDSYLKEKDKKKKDEEEKKAKLKEAEGFEVGKQLDFKGKWAGNQLWFETEDKAFRFHFGGRTQIDAAFVHAPHRVMQPIANGGIGEFDDAVNFRRARLEIDGTFWEVFDFFCEYDFLNAVRIVPGGNVLAGRTAGGAPINPQTLNNLAGTVADRRNIINTPVPTDLWIQWSKIPVIGNVRVGNQKPLYSFEHFTSSRYLDWLERSYAFDAFVENGNNGFSPGITAFNNLLDNRLNLGAGVFKVNTVDIFGYNVGDGEYQGVARVWGTPIYEEHGRCMVHLGLGYTHRGADDGIVRYRARTMIRNGSAVHHNTVAIIQAQAHNESILVPELAVNYGPFSLSAEYYATWANQRPGEVFQSVAGQGTADLPAALRAGRGSLFYSGAYVTLGYFLTGEHRSYNQRAGGWDRQAVNEYAFCVDGDEGLLFGRGAWQVLARYQYLDLSDKGINGGIINSLTLGLNWFLNPNAKIQFNYEIAYRDVDRFAAGVPVLPAADGIFQGFGTRFAFDW